MTRIIEVMTDILQANETTAADNRQLLAKYGVTTINMMSSPGAGKTTLIERTIEALAGSMRVGVIEGDIETTRDAERLDKYDVPVVQINTRSTCHLNATMVRLALEKIDLSGVDLLIVENVGNLVCPAEFQIGEDAKVVVLSVTEGDEKPLKYPAMFRASTAMVINKTDLVPYTNFSLAEARANAHRVNEELRIIEVSCATGEGIDQWVAWLTSLRRRRKD